MAEKARPTEIRDKDILSLLSEFSSHISLRPSDDPLQSKPIYHLIHVHV
jgi:hypothetical protein